MNNLKKRREELSLTQKQVSDTLKIDIRLYQYYEAGQREPKVNAAIKIAEQGLPDIKQKARQL